MKLFAITLFAASAICRASTTYTVNETLTLNPAAITSSAGIETYIQQFSVASPATVQAGDIITGTISFIGGPILIASPSGSLNESVAIDFSPVSASPSTSSTYSLGFQGLQGIFPESNPVTGSASGGPFVSIQFSNSSAFDFSFTGLTYTIDINSLSTGPTAFYFSQFSLEGQTVDFGTAIPEPSSLAFCGMGCLALAWVVRLRRKASAI